MQQLLLWMHFLVSCRHALAGFQLKPYFFFFGVLAQVEGGVELDGRSASIWDTFSSSSSPGRIADNSTATSAADHYHLFQQDVRLMAALGIKHYRWVADSSRDRLKEHIQQHH